MAILPAHPGLTVQVVVDDQPLPEYDDDDASQDVGSVTKYIQACAGSEFKIQYSFDKTFPRNKDVRISCSIDGSIARKPTRRKFELGKGNIFSIDGTREKDGKNWKMRMFCFESLIIADAHDIEYDQEVGMVGTIKLAFHFGNVTPSDKPSQGRTLQHQGTVSETTLKGGAKSLQVGRGVTKTTSCPNSVHFAKEDRGPFAIFLFKYRSHANLQSLHIIPREPSLSPPATIKGVDDSNSPSPEIPSIESEGNDIENEISAPVPDQEVPNKHRATPLPVPNATPRAISVVEMPAPRHQSSARTAPIEDHGLTTEELIIIIAGYRGHDKGLARQNHRSLMTLLKHYESKDIQSTKVKTEPISNGEGGVRIKRERDDGAAGGRSIEKAKVEVIVIDE